jgi:hypothetical protein
MKVIALFDEIRETDREGEYRVPKRDSVSTGKLTLPDGATVDYTRYVNRVGYALDPRSYTKEEWEAAGLEIVCKNSGLDEETVKTVLKELNLHSPYKGVRGQIYTKLVGDKANDFIRSMWFKDFKPGHSTNRQTWRGVIIGRCRKWTGKYYHGHTYGAWWQGDTEYDPPMLDGVNQNLYLVKNYDNGITYMVHPGDITSFG